MSETPRRFPSYVYRRGEEPDPRFSLANERTFLAWVRTALALMAAGVALEALELPENTGFRLAAALIFVLLGLLAAIHAWLSWARTERALRLSSALPAPATTLIIVVGVVVAVGLVLVGFVLELR
ncbi:YidH family protein [Microbacterium xanthum]|uniref:YidH family protein n=1 Tax=Microbacterium xanthum TaxID=3079794 RepID=UPI002AD54A1C|nr:MULTISPECIES: DUF202 domain-containing protein [unclassified Microbacterium]MDZ8170524.1 DUF202 domain-containing protein [Microbacterium sp. KSW-48]MDZ8201046.1 DUF202 domain-containing protein [Microbacterium sp. SSW1-59]